MITKILTVLLATTFIHPTEFDYCNKTASSFPMPAFECMNSGDNLIKSLCFQGCYQTYLEECLFACGDACEAQNKADLDFDICVEIANFQYTTCMYSSHTASAKSACRDALNSSLNECMLDYMLETNKIAAAFYSSISESLEQFYNCTSWCCHEL